MYKGKALYQTRGPAREYGKWGINFYKGCSGQCSYCYLRRPPLNSEMGGGNAVLKKRLNNESCALQTACREITSHAEQIRQDGGIFFSFSTDPCLVETVSLTLKTALFCAENDIPVKILTKQTGWLSLEETKTLLGQLHQYRKLVQIGFTLTGHDELEPGSATNEGRINAMREIHAAGYKTFASLTYSHE